MSLAKDNIWKLLAPLVVMGVMFLIPVPDGMPPQAWHYFAVFVAMIVGMILEPIPATAISFIAVTICVIGSNYLLFDAKELADPAFNAQKQALKWGLAGFSSTTVWLVFGAFIFALGYEVSGLGRWVMRLSLSTFCWHRLHRPTPRVPGVRFFRSLKTCRRCLNHSRTIRPRVVLAAI